jgi:hypothetical protein
LFSISKFLEVNSKTILQVSVLVSAAASLALSISVYFAGNDESDKLNGIYVGVWVPSILALGAFILAGQRNK